MSKCGLLFIVLAILNPGLIYKFILGVPWGNVAEIVQAITGLFGVVGLLCTLILQRKALQSQQEQFAEQAKTQRKEDVKNRFFKMLDYHNEIVSQISVIEYKVKKGVFVSKIETTELHGRQAFVAYKKQLKELYKFVAEITTQNEKKTIEKKTLMK